VQGRECESNVVFHGTVISSAPSSVLCKPPTHSVVLPSTTKRSIVTLNALTLAASTVHRPHSPSLPSGPLPIPIPALLASESTGPARQAEQLAWSSPTTPFSSARRKADVGPSRRSAPSERAWTPDPGRTAGKPSPTGWLAASPASQSAEGGKDGLRPLDGRRGGARARRVNPQFPLSKVVAAMQDRPSTPTSSERG
jgi:hypothetical protein